MTEYRTLRLSTDKGVATICFDNGELNLFDEAMVGDLIGAVETCAHDDAVRVIVFKSANPDFFIAHVDLNLLDKIDLAAPDGELGAVPAFMKRLRTLPKVTIAQIEGRARGGGAELALACDMRFGATETCVMGFPEVGSGILPGAGGTVHLAALVGPGRASEILLGSGDYRADVAERYGLINRAVPAAEIDTFVDRLAKRIARFPAASVGLAKQAIADEPTRYHEKLLTESAMFAALLTDERRASMRASLQTGMQTVAVETMCFDDLYDMAAEG